MTTACTGRHSVEWLPALSLSTFNSFFAGLPAQACGLKDFRDRPIRAYCFHQLNVKGVAPLFLSLQQCAS